ncbi:histidine phosphatase family protein [Candidatus Uhrbacteria bacterium]|nr:histidine phosphatase family protein [Candidatus Uhrbacteria bacterium]
MHCPLVIWSIRHGESRAQAPNLDRDERSRRDLPNWMYELSEEGAHQSRCAGEWMRERDLVPDAILTTDFRRGLQTADNLGFGDDVYREEHAMLAEQDFGLWYWNTEQEMRERFPNEVRRRDAFRTKKKPSFQWTPLGGESGRLLEMRAWILWADLCQRFAGQKVALVNHGTKGAILMKMLLRISAANYERDYAKILHPENASIRIFHAPTDPSCRQLMTHDPKVDYVVPWMLGRQ